MKNIVYILKQRMMHCLRIGQKYAFALNPLKNMLTYVVDRISLQKLEYEMKRVDLPDDYNYFEIGYCGQPAFHYAHNQLEKATKLIL